MGAFVSELSFRNNRFLTFVSELCFIPFCSELSFQNFCSMIPDSQLPFQSLRFGHFVSRSLFQRWCFKTFVSELCFRTFVSDLLFQNFLFQNFRFRTFRFRTEAGGTSELRLGEPGAGGSHLEGRPGEPKKMTGETSAGAGSYRRIKVIE